MSLMSPMDWPTMSESDPRMARVLKNPLVGLLRQIQSIDPRLTQLLITDRFGQTIAATGRTKDFYQGDETWWMQSYNNGQGSVLVEAVNYDEGLQPYDVSLSIPIRRKGQVVGILRTELDIGRWAGAQTRSIGEFSASSMLVQDDGTIQYRPGVTPLTTKVEDWAEVPRQSDQPSWRITDSGEIQALAPIRISTKESGYQIDSPVWYLVLYLPQSEPLAAVSSLAVSVWFYAVKLKEAAPWLGYAISAVALWCLIFVGVMSMFVMPALVQKKGTVMATLKLSALLALDNPLFCVGLALQFLLLASVMVIPLISVFLAGSCGMVLASSAYEMLARKYAVAAAGADGGGRLLNRDAPLVFDDENDDYLNRGFRDFLFPWKG